VSTRPTIIEQPSTDAVEAAKAKYWRKARRFTRKDLARVTGYSVRTIGLFEQGYDQFGRPLGPRAWNKYRLVCAGLDNPTFHWGMDKQHG